MIHQALHLFLDNDPEVFVIVVGIAALCAIGLIGNVLERMKQ